MHALSNERSSPGKGNAWAFCLGGNANAIEPAKAAKIATAENKEGIQQCHLIGFLLGVLGGLGG
ncbi:MAG: hypothetical protein ABSH22_20200 [Tepidisphaeraceae bacterium]